MQRILSLTTLVILFTLHAANAQQNYEAWYRLRAAIDRQEKSEALEWIDSCLKLKPLRYYSYIDIGKAYYLNEQYNDALVYFKKAESVRSNSASYLLARTYSMLGDTSSCFLWLQKNLESAQREKESVILLDRAFDSIQKAQGWKNIWEKDWYNSLNKVTAEAEYLNGNQRFEESLDLLNTRIKGSKSRFVLYELRGDAYLNLNNPQAAADDYSIAYKKSKKNPVYLAKIAQALVARKQYPPAIKKINEAIEKSNGDPTFYLDRAKIYGKMGQPAYSFDDLKYYLTFYPNNTEAMELLPESAYNAGQYVDALWTLAKLIKTNPDNPRYHFLRGITYIKTEQPRLAITELDIAIVNEYNVAEAYYHKGIALINLGEYPEACKCFSASVRYGKFNAQEWLYKYCKK